MRVLLKISGEALSGNEGFGFDKSILDEVGQIVKELKSKKIELGIVVGSGNFIRGAEIEKINIDRCNADNMGMLAININCIALMDVLSKVGIESKIYNSFDIDGVTQRFHKSEALKLLSDGKVLIFGGGTGNPYFTTDTAGVLRALEIDADFMIKATKVDGVYDKDPVVNLNAKLIKKATYDEVISKNLRVMDATAFALAKENKMPIKVVNLFKKGAILAAIKGKNEGSEIS